VRAGATVVSVGDQLWLPTDSSIGGFRPVAFPAAPVAPLQLEPRNHTVEAVVATPVALFPHIADDPGLAVTVKADLGEELVRAADAAMLMGPPGPLAAIATRGAINVAAAGDVLATLRAMLEAVFARAPRPAFRNAGWILHPSTVDHLSRARTSNGQIESGVPSARPLADYDLLRFESAYGGLLLGLPFVTSAETMVAPGPPPQVRIFLSADWDEAWIGVDPSVVAIDLPGGAAVGGARVVRASLPVDFELRREAAFAWADFP
jgi:hypothetical protein